MLGLYENLSGTVAQPPSAVALPKTNTGEGACATNELIPNCFVAESRQPMAESRVQAIFPAAFFGSTCPPNFCRIADSVFSANVCSWRERKRVYNAAVSTSAGTAVATAASIVQRPSPESCTKPLYCESSGSSMSAIDVRSSSHDATTDPRRHTSAISARFRL